MRLFWELLAISFRRQLTYRAANLAGLATNTFFGFLRASVMIALYGSDTTVAGVSLTEAITYTGLSQAVIGYISIFGWYDLMNSVYSGEVGSDLLKPLSLFRLWLSRDVGRALGSFLMRSLPIMLLYALYFEITVPATFTQWLALLVSLSLGLLVSFAFRFLVNLASFWTPNALGIGRMAFGLVWILSGFFMPLRFFPAWFTTFAHLTPFPAMVNTAIEVYLGLLTGGDLVWALAQQALWMMVLFIAGELVLRAGVRRLVVQGG